MITIRDRLCKSRKNALQVQRTEVPRDRKTPVAKIVIGEAMVTEEDANSNRKELMLVLENVL